MHLYGQIFPSNLLQTYYPLLLSQTQICFKLIIPYSCLIVPCSCLKHKFASNLLSLAPVSNTNLLQTYYPLLLSQTHVLQPKHLSINPCPIFHGSIEHV
jgi:hypothetical protein